MSVGFMTLTDKVDEHAPGSIAEAFRVEVPHDLLRPNWLGSLVGIRNRAATDQVVAKILRPRLLQEAHETAIASFANEARILTRLQRMRRVTPLLGYGTLAPGAVLRRGSMEVTLSDSLEEYEAAVAETTRTGRLPFLLLGNVPFEWTLLEPFITRAYEPGCTPEFRFAEAVEIAIALLRFLDQSRAEVGAYHFDMKLEHVAWREGCLIVIDWNLSRLYEPGLQEGVLYEDLRRLFVRVLYPLFTGKDIDGNDPTAVWGRIGDVELYPDQASGLLPFRNVERLRDTRLRRWLSRGFERPGRSFPTHAAAAAELETWLLDALADQPLWPRLDLLVARCAELEAELEALVDEGWKLRDEAREHRGSDDVQFMAELARLAQGLSRFRAARPVAITRSDRARPDILPWGRIRPDRRPE
jgi:hypothetical protein